MMWKVKSIYPQWSEMSDANVKNYVAIMTFLLYQTEALCVIWASGQVITSPYLFVNQECISKKSKICLDKITLNTFQVNADIPAIEKAIQASGSKVRTQSACILIIPMESKGVLGKMRQMKSFLQKRKTFVER